MQGYTTFTRSDHGRIYSVTDFLIHSSVCKTIAERGSPSLFQMIVQSAPARYRKQFIERFSESGGLWLALYTFDLEWVSCLIDNGVTGVTSYKSFLELDDMFLDRLAQLALDDPFRRFVRKHINKIYTKEIIQMHKCATMTCFCFKRIMRAPKYLARDIDVMVEHGMLDLLNALLKAYPDLLGTFIVERYFYHPESVKVFGQNAELRHLLLRHIALHRTPAMDRHSSIVMELNQVFYPAFATLFCNRGMSLVHPQSQLAQLMQKSVTAEQLLSVTEGITDKTKTSLLSEIPLGTFARYVLPKTQTRSFQDHDFTPDSAKKHPGILKLKLMCFYNALFGDNLYSEEAKTHFFIELNRMISVWTKERAQWRTRPLIRVVVKRPPRYFLRSKSRKRPNKV